MLSMFLLQREADPADTVVALGVVSKLRASEGIRPGGVHHPQDRFTPFLCSLTERSTGKEATPKTERRGELISYRPGLKTVIIIRKPANSKLMRTISLYFLSTVSNLNFHIQSQDSFSRPITRFLKRSCYFRST